VTTPPRLIARSGSALAGAVNAPGDKSVSHRALILAGMAHGPSSIEGLLEGDDVLATARAIRAMGAQVERIATGRWRVIGQGELRQPSHVIDCGNAGTGVRLLMGAAAGFPISVAFDGDASLRKRPMNRVVEPLSEMGCRFAWMGADEGRLPLRIHGGSLAGRRYRQKAASAQVKSAVLLAGLNAAGETTVVEPVPSRDHTERMLREFGAEVSTTRCDGEALVRIRGAQRLSGTDVLVPGDPSSAAFPLAAALVIPGSEVTVRSVMLNPLRTGLFETWLEMGADLTITDRRWTGGEEVGDVTARHSALVGVAVPERRAASMIDEYPILAATAAFARGSTVMRGIGEMRVKESDRISLMAAGLRSCGVEVEEEREGLIVTGGSVRGGSDVATHGDHRIAMSHLVLGLAASHPVSVDAPEMIATSFPGFVQLMRGLGADIATAG
jgi:3-phosphoshikimate 1-carboxyvinyltransferase